MPGSAILLAVSLLFAMALSLATAPVCAQDDEAQTRARLAELATAMQQLSTQLKNDRAELSKLQQQLRDTELQLATLSGDIRQTRQDIADTGEQLEALATRQQQLRLRQAEQRDRVVTEINQAYQMGRQGQLKVLLNQQQPSTMARTMAYYRYIYEAREQHLQEYQNTLAQLATVEQEIVRQQTELAQTRSTLEQQQTQLQSAQQRRSQTIALLDNSIANKDQQLSGMRADQKELEALLQAIQQALVSLTLPEDYKPFAEARGAMPWPLPGKPSNSFGRTRNKGSLRWQGITIPAREGTEVRAIHYGRVVYADWFRGSGLLLIIDHGDGYMSLYAHNQSLMREVGEWVAAGTPIATAGNTGGLQKSALYFEIRHQGKPVNPARWCRG